MLCPVGDCGNIVIFAIFAKFASIANFYGPLTALYFALLTIVAILSFSPYLLNSPVSPTFMGPLIALCFALLAIVAKLSFSPYLLNSPVSPTFMGPLIALCFAMLAILAKLSFLPYLPNSPVSPTFMGLPHCFVLCHVGDSGKIVIFAIFAKFAIMFSFLPFLLLRAFLDISPRSDEVSPEKIKRIA